MQFTLPIHRQLDKLSSSPIFVAFVGKSANLTFFAWFALVDSTDTVNIRECVRLLINMKVAWMHFHAVTKSLDLLAGKFTAT